MRFYTESKPGLEVRQHWQGIVFPHVGDRSSALYKELDKLPIITSNFWRETQRQRNLGSKSAKSQTILYRFVLIILQEDMIKCNLYQLYAHQIIFFSKVKYQPFLTTEYVTSAPLLQHPNHSRYRNRNRLILLLC